MMGEEALEEDFGDSGEDCDGDGGLRMVEEEEEFANGGGGGGRDL